MNADLPDTMLNRFFALARLGRDGPFTVELRALCRERPVVNSLSLWAFELTIYANDIMVGRRTATDLPQNKLSRVDAMMGEMLRQTLLFGMYVKARQAQELEDDYPGNQTVSDWLCPPRLGLNNRIDGELLPTDER